MPKKIKKILFHQVSAFLGLAVIVSFSAIFGAILMHQVLAAPVGQGSVITGLADIKGTGFVANTHSLKQIRDKLDTMGGGGINYLKFLKGVVSEYSDLYGDCAVYITKTCPNGGQVVAGRKGVTNTTVSATQCWSDLGVATNAKDITLGALDTDCVGETICQVGYTTGASYTYCCGYVAVLCTGS